MPTPTNPSLRYRDWKSPVFGEHCPAQIEWAMMAAYIDGEGSIVMPPRRGQGRTTVTVSLLLHVANTDIRLPQWCQRIFGGSYCVANKSEVYRGRNVKDCYHWSTTATRAAWIIYNCLPFFVIKRDQAELAIALQESITKRNTEKQRPRLLPEEVVQERLELKRKLSQIKKRGRIDWSQRTISKEVN